MIAYPKIRNNSRTTINRKPRRNRIPYLLGMTLLGSVILASAVSAGYYGTRYISNRKATRSSAPPKTTEAPAIKRILSASATQDAAPRLVTDKTGYVAGETVNISGSGYAAGETVTIQVKHADGSAESGGGHEAFPVNAGADGTIAATWNLNRSDSSGNDFAISAVGGSSGSGGTAQFNRIATVGTDKYDYRPGETVVITGEGFQPNEPVTLQVVHSNGNNSGAGHEPFAATADANGGLAAPWFVNPDDSESSIFRLTATGNNSHLVATSTFTDVLLEFIDDNGPDDQPGQKDLSKMSSDVGLTQIGITWNWDDTDFGNIGGNTGDACALVDTDQDGKANYAFCVGVDGNPAAKQYNTLYSCGDSRSDRCAQPADPIATFLSTSTASVVANSDPFRLAPFNILHSDGNDCDNDANCLTADTVANVSLKFSDVGGSSSTTKLLNVCSYPSGEPNSDPSDCVVTPDSGFLTIKKTTITNAGETGSFTFDSTPASQDGTSTFSANTTGSQTVTAVNQISFAPTNTLSLAETIPTGWDLTATCQVQDANLTPTGNLSGNTISGISIQNGLETICTFTNSAFSVTRGKIIVDKVTVPADSQLFTFTPNYNGGATFQLNDASQPNDSGFLTVPATYSVAETANSDYTTTATCTSDDGDPADDPSAIHLRAGEIVTCTFTNTKKPKLTVIKHVVNDNGGSAVASDFTLSVDDAGTDPPSFAGAEAPGTTIYVDAGSYSVGETGPSGYSASYSADCSGTIAAGESKTCTVTNNDQPGKLTIIKHVINNNGGTAVASDFTLDSGGTNDSPDNFAGSESGTEVTLDAGNYAVTESGPSGYTRSDSADCSGTIAIGQSKTCTVTNDDQPGKLTIIKHVINDNGGTATAANFTLDSGGAGDTPDNFAGAEDPGTEVTLDAGAYNVTESGPSGYTASYSADCSGSIANGQTKTCTVTNDDKAAKLIVIKHVINDNGGTATAANFTLDSGGTNDTPDDFAGAESPGTEITLDAGSYNVTETGPAGYTASYSAYCSGTIANGQTKTCTVTNNDQAAKLIVIKHVINDNGGTATAANFTLDSGGTNDTPDDFAGAESPGTMVTLDAGSYNVTESGPAGYSASFSAYCSGSIANGQTKTCTVTNNDISPTLRVIKDIVPDTDIGLFNLRIDGTTAGTGANVGDGGTTGFVPVNAGNHTVSETAGTSTTLSDYVSVIGGDCAASGSVSLALAENKTCTITNTKKGMARIVKTVRGLTPPAGQSFTFEIREGASTSSDGTVLESKSTDASGNINFTTKLVAGQTYQMCEWVFPGWNTNLAGDGPLFVPNSIIPPALPNPNVNNLTVCADFTVQPGQTRAFNVDNSPPPGGRGLTIGFWKNWASCAKSNGGQKPMLDLALGFASAATTNPPGGLVVSAQNPGSLWPNYAATWYLVLKGNPASTKDSILNAPDCNAAVSLLNKSSIDGKGKMSSDPLFNMTAQLIAAELNRFMGAGISGTTIMNIDRAVLLNGKYKFNGNTYNPKLTAADTAIANCLATQLDNYNNNRPVSLCP